MYTKNIEYTDGDAVLQAFVAYDDKSTAKRPAVIVAHDWSGRNDFAQDKARKLAELGYVGFALDMFGKGISGSTKEEKSKLIQPFVEDRTKLQKRILAALNTLKTLEQVDTSKIAAIGFCFGGMCVLDLARSGADIRGVVSFHGLLFPAEGVAKAPIKAKVLALHGYEDPLAPPDQVSVFEKEMTQAKADWQLHMYGGTLNAFTNPAANDPGFGTMYNAVADKRSWLEMRNFFDEIF
jgi:dienelactone hydrolase